MTRRRRFLVTLEAGNGWQELLEHAARLATAIRAELHTCFIEDEDLPTIAELPFTVEISLYRGQRRNLSPEELRRNQREQLRQAKALVDKILHQSQLRGSFETLNKQQAENSRRQGDIYWHHRRHLIHPGSPTPLLHDTLFLAISGSDHDPTLLDIASTLLQQDYRRLVILNLSQKHNVELLEQFDSHHKPVEIRPIPADITLDELLASIDNYASNTLLLPHDLPVDCGGSKLDRQLAEYRFESLIVH